MPELQLDYSPEVAEALASGNPVLALESTIIAHGMPWPQNLETALRVETLSRSLGVTPATCAVIKGRLKAGLTESELEYLGKNGPKIPKASRRDLPYLLSKGLDGATTVAATMIIAWRAGIRVFATGGIGGVHRGGAHTMDISADLPELANTPVAVVSAGAKSILDLGLTREYLETQGIPVVGYQTRHFPAFYTRESDFFVDYQLDTAQEIAQLLRSKWALDPRGGVLIANPIPEPYSMDPAYIEGIIQAALSAADQEGIQGKGLTPFLLARIEEESGGKSLQANIELVLNNVRLGAGIATAWAAL
ncbi:MAG: pseudouridine-5'-phosphate glycosidase [Lewinellaceae bacterium]|nr:pseudouridine-5'-phosphate glycosidase [Lewinellaceae bacterium]